MLLVALYHLDITKNFSATMEQDKRPTLVMFYANWCINYHDFKPTWDALTSDLVYFAEVDCVYSRDICQEERIKGYPTLKLYVDGEVLDMYMGAKDGASIRSWVKSKVDPY